MENGEVVMKGRILVALATGATVCSIVVGMAATLGGITTGKLGADDAVVAACDTNGVSTGYTTSYSSTATAGYKVGSVTVSGIADACDGETMSVTLTGASNTSLGEQTATVDVNSGGGDTSDTVSFAASNVLAESVTGIHVAIAD
jgi:hypothetical protein